MNTFGDEEYGLTSRFFNVPGRKSVAASSFLFNAAPNSLSAATEAAVKDIASEILEVEDGHNVDQPSASWQVGHGAVAPVSHSFKAPPDPWASSDDEPSPKAGQSENQRHVPTNMPSYAVYPHQSGDVNARPHTQNTHTQEHTLTKTQTHTHKHT